MEVIRIPQVSLVDATGRKIGVYSDDPDWWQQLKLKHQAAEAITDGTEQNQTRPESGSPSNKSVFDSATSLNAKLIKGEKKKQVQIATVALADAGAAAGGAFEDNQKECNMIGETPLHIAIMYDDLNTIKYLIEIKDFDVNQRCVGGKFTGGFNVKLTASLVQQSKYEGLAYYGEYPLAFAACFANKEIYDYLVEKGADPNLQDTNGNTVLHVLVINNKLVSWIGFF
jgi:ankyrin repeat protein